MPVIISDGPPTGDNLDTYIANLEAMHSAYQFDKILVWQDLQDTNFANYIDFFNDFYAGFAPSGSVGIYGPNTTVTFTGGEIEAGAATILTDFIAQADTFDGLAFAIEVGGSFSDADFPDLITYIRETINYSGNLVVRVKGTPTDPQPLYDSLGENDVVLWPSDRVAEYTANQPSGSNYWTFSGTLDINDLATNLTLRVNTLSNPLRGGDATITIEGDTFTLPTPGNLINLGTYGIADTPSTLTYSISGRTNATGTGILNATFSADTLISVIISGSTAVVG